MPVETQDAVFRTVAAVLHLGNITFEDDGNEAAKVSAGDAERSLASAAALLGVEGSITPSRSETLNSVVKTQWVFIASLPFPAMISLLVIVVKLKSRDSAIS